MAVQKAANLVAETVWSLADHSVASSAVKMVARLAAYLAGGTVAETVECLVALKGQQKVAP